MACPNGCKVDMVEKRVERLFHKNESPIIVKNLAIKVCPECGQEAIPLSSMRIIDDILKGKIKSTGTLQAPIFQAA